MRDAFAYGPMCPQNPRPRPSFAASWAVDTPMSEDCLVLNIWTPGLRESQTTGHGLDPWRRLFQRFRFEPGL